MNIQSSDQSVKRAYRSPRRRQQAQETKKAILDAAHELFLENGYAGTSIRAVAERASVSEQTVYNAFEDKAGLLWSVSMRVVGGEADGVDGNESRLFEDLEAEPDPLERIRITARVGRQVWEQGMLEFESMVFNPEIKDPRLEELAQNGWDLKYAEISAGVRLLFPSDIRRAGVKLVDIADTIMAIDTASTLKILIENCGWTFDKYEKWLGDFMITQFLDPDWVAEHLGE